MLVSRGLGTLRGTAVPWTIALYLLAFAAYLGALVWLERGGRWPAAWAWGTAVFSRLLLLLTSPTLSDDVYRYIWDGWLTLRGVSPYAFVVNAPALDYLAIPERALVNNDWMASPYLPAAQALFALAALIGRQPFILQLLMVLLDLLAAAVIANLLVVARLPGRLLLLYLWNPLVVVEVAHGAHLDAAMVLLSLLAVQAALLYPAGGVRGLFSPLWLALATLTKPLPALLAPALFWRWSWAQRLLYPLLLLLALLPFGAAAGWGLDRGLSRRGVFGALLIYTSRWKFNSGLFWLLEGALAALGLEPTAATAAAKAILGFGLLLILAAVFLRARRAQSAAQTLRLAAVPFMAYILITPTFHPWYLLIVIAFLPFWPPAPIEAHSLGPRTLAPRTFAPLLPWLWLSGTAVLSYLAYLDPGAFRERPWVRLVQWLPTWLLLLAPLWRDFRRRSKLSGRGGV